MKKLPSSDIAKRQSEAEVFYYISGYKFLDIKKLLLWTSHSGSPGRKFSAYELLYQGCHSF